LIDDLLVASHLDDTWRSPPSVQRLLKRWQQFEVADALRRLAGAGKIEKREDPTPIPKFRGSMRKIESYRRLQ
jgi:hypothetical protein